MSIRISGGYLGGRILKTVPGKTTRPTTGRTREAVFSILQHDIEGAEALDLFAGSGALAIEAVSRGAKSAVLVERNRKALGIIRANLESCELDSRVIAASYLTAMQLLSEEKAQFDLVFADPPYGLIKPEKMYQLVVEYSLIRRGGFLIMEHAGNIRPQEEHIITTRRFGDSAITIFGYD